MSSAEELLNTLTDEEIAAYSTGPIEEPHIVIGEDRHITVPEQLKRIAVQFNHDVETVTFDCPRYWDDTDLSKLPIYINYMLPDGNKAVMLQIQFPNSSDTGSGTPNFEIWIDKGQCTCGYFTFNNKSKTTYVGFAEIKGGRVFGGVIDAATSKTNTQPIKSTPNATGIFEGTTIGQVRIPSGIPANSVVTISGIKR